MNTPVALIIFRRPDLTRRVFDAIAQTKPHKLLIIADGPRPDRPGQKDACDAARAVVDRVDWDCEVLKCYSDVNLGCGKRPATGISWVFEQVEEAIILEDDCVPDPSFFPFCEELLARYRDDERVMHINGSTYTTIEAPLPHSYHFSQFVGCWGWATWRRAWKYYDFAVKLWPEFRKTGWLETALENNEAALRFWSDKFQRAYDRTPDLTFWDYQWAFTCWSQCGLGIVPRHNLVLNIGCGQDATHTFDDPAGKVAARPMPFPLVHPPMVLHHRNHDRKLLREVFLPSITEKPVPPLRRLRNAVSRMTPAFVKHTYRASIGKSRPLTDSTRLTS